MGISRCISASSSDEAQENILTRTLFYLIIIVMIPYKFHKECWLCPKTYAGIVHIDDGVDAVLNRCASLCIRASFCCCATPLDTSRRGTVYCMTIQYCRAEKALPCCSLGVTILQGRTEVWKFHRLVGLRKSGQKHERYVRNTSA